MSAKGFNLPKVPDPDRRHRDVARVVEALESLPLASPWHVRIEQAKAARSLKQNRYLFGVAYALLAERTGYEKDDLHEYLLGKHFGTYLKKVPKSQYNPRGLVEMPVRTTTTDENGRRSVIGKLEFAEYVAFVQRFAANVGIVIPDPDPELAVAA